MTLIASNTGVEMYCHVAATTSCGVCALPSRPVWRPRSPSSWGVLHDGRPRDDVKGGWTQALKKSAGEYILMRGQGQHYKRCDAGQPAQARARRQQWPWRISIEAWHIQHRWKD